LFPVAVALRLRARITPRVPQVRFSELLMAVDGGRVAEVIVNGDVLDMKLSNGAIMRTVAPPNYITVNGGFISDLAKKNVRIEVRSAPEQSAYSYGAL